METKGKKISRALKKWHATHEHPKGMLGKHHSEKTIDDFSRARIGRGNPMWHKKRPDLTAWNERMNFNPEFRKRILVNREPSINESFFLELIKEYNLPLKYVGNGQLMIEYLCPDFQSTKNPKLILELVNGRSWATLIKKKLSVYRKQGYKVIWIENRLLKKAGQFQNSLNTIFKKLQKGGFID